MSVAARQVVHDAEQHLFEDGAQPAGAGAPQQRLIGDGLERVVGELELDVLELEELLVLLHQRVLRLDEDLGRAPRWSRLTTAPMHRQAADELGDQAELERSSGSTSANSSPVSFSSCSADVGAEADALARRAAAR